MIAVVDYKAGNLRSVERALNRLGVPCAVTADPDAIRSADRVIFPGVGAAGAAVEDLEAAGIDRVLRELFDRGTPFLGICLGAQIILERSEENDAACLGLLPGTVTRFPSPLLDEAGERLKVPHMGWNGLRKRSNHPVLEDVRETDEFYFVHGYYPRPAAERYVIATTEYGTLFPSVIGTRNLVAMQFHPEKSGAPGLRILERFARWDGRDAE
ncbi:MAG: imidazole glycerol phosphate synthase subunit HisH [Deltaproteobacteria bacterium]|nr:imidazole glycerol phosphate synthase subunit HisH [Deltaproteobacteria bacterium]